MAIKSSTSFYNTEEEFKKYLLRTSYYSGLQKNLVALVPSESKIVLDLGTGTGSTAIQIAKKCSKGVVHATDLRQEILVTAAEIAKRENVSNMRFGRVDMNKLGSYLSENSLKPDVVTALYAFHHVGDPIKNKKKVVKEIYENMGDGGKVIIGDLYTEVDYTGKDYTEKTKQQYVRRAEEGYNSVFWAVARETIASGKTIQEIIGHAKEVAEYSMESELNAMNGALKRSEAKVPEYLIVW